ncbi:SDR family oxidoreductase [Ensifer sp. BR816]|uniref:SDR family oxidoreductase n=1 Tax=Rhizobium sp. (strain BR816) TaxID=1057002 RepID=UPI00035C2323|nr:SDR family oxidoreductase [Ensifer sp. BR816]
MFDLTGKTALVTGGGRGLGLEMASALAKAGAWTVINGRSRKSLEEARERLAGEGIAIGIAPGDITRDVGSILAQVADRTGQLDILVHAVGERDRRGTEAMEPEDFAQLLNTDLTAAYAVARTALPLLQRSTAGRLIFVTSIAAFAARAGDPAYTAAKGGLSALTRSLAVEHGADNLTVNAIAPGWFATETNAHLAADPALQAFVEVRIPLKRWGRPEEIAPAAVFLASPAASFVNGITLTVDGGMTVQM